MTTHLRRPLAVHVTPLGRIILMPTPLATAWPPELDDEAAETLSSDLADAVQRSREIQAHR